MIYRVIIYLIISLATYFSSIRWLSAFRYEDFKDYLTLISGVSGMVFTIMGIWIAFLYPNAMARITSPEKIIAKDFSESRSDSRRLEGIVGAVICSALVMIAALFMTLAKIIIMALPIYACYRVEIKSLALAGLVFITLIQLESVLHVVLSNILFINDLHFKRKSRQADEEM